jgi:uncharacterized protein with PQ loop repeat
VGLTDLAGAAAVASSLLFVWPQVRRLVRTRDPNGISVLGALWAMSGFTLWSAYGIDRHALPILIANAQALVGFAIVLALRLRWGAPVGMRGFRLLVGLGAVVVVVVGATAPAAAVGIAALSVGATSYLPQTYVALRAPDVAGVSATTYVLLAISSSLWILYGVLRRDALIVAPNLLIVPTATVIAIRALRTADTDLAADLATDAA